MSNLSEQFDPFQRYPNVSFRHMPTPGGTGWRDLSEYDPEELGLEWGDTHGRAGGPFGGRRGISTTVGELIVGGAVDTDFTGWGRSDGGLKIPVLGTRTSDHARGFDVEQTAGGLTAGRELDRFSFSPITEYPIPNDDAGDSEHTRGAGNRHMLARHRDEYWKIPSMSVNVRIPPASRGGVALAGVSSWGLWADGLPWTEKGWAEHYDTETRGESGLSQIRVRPARGATATAARVEEAVKADRLAFDPTVLTAQGWQADSPQNQSLPDAITDHHTFFLQELQNYRDELYRSSEFPSEFYRQGPD
jgi:hypothetical protein